MAKPAIFVAAIVLTGCVSTGAWRDLRIDGSSQSSFEESVTSFQQELSSKRRDLFEISLVAVWMADTAGAGDFDQDGDVDADDADTLLEKVQSGTLVSAIQAGELYRQFDGMGYDEVLNLAGPELVEEYRSIRYARQRRNRANHRMPQGTWGGICCQ